MLRVLAHLTNPVRRDDRGLTAVEYALLLMLVAAVIVGALTIFGHALSGVFSTEAFNLF